MTFPHLHMICRLALAAHRPLPRITRALVAGMTSLLAIAAPDRTADAGPPLSIDDPGILEPGQLEVIVSGAMDSRDSGDAYLLPILDVSYGISTDVQVAAVVTRAVFDPGGESSKSDFGPCAIGVKWRFLNRDALQMSMAPFYEAQLRQGAVHRDVVGDLEAWVLPVEFQYQFPAIRLNAEVRYAFVRDDADAWLYGIAAAYPLLERVELLAELHGFADRSFDDDSLFYRLGVDVTLVDSLHLLSAVGAGIDEPGDDDLDLQVYLGLQWFH